VAPATAGTPRPRGPALRLKTEPALASIGDTSPLAARVRAVLNAIEWPGKPGASAPLAALTADETARFNAGREVYATVCAACHQEDGRGRLGLAPSLVGSDLAVGAEEIPIRILLNGKEGSTGLMPPLGATMADDKVAAVLTYIRREWGQPGAPVETAAVAAARKATTDRTKPWTAEELTALANALSQEGRR
jgi:mono/diheme cytochrome c family protein